MLFFCERCEVEVEVDLEADPAERRCPRCMRKSTLVDARVRAAAAAKALAADRPGMGANLLLIAISSLLTGASLLAVAMIDELLGVVFAPVLFGVGVAGYGAIRFASRAGDDPAETGPWTPRRIAQVYAIRLGVSAAAGATVTVAGVIARLVVGPDSFFTTLALGVVIWLVGVVVVGTIVGRVIRRRKG